jgi:hypothetical protein
MSNKKSNKAIILGNEQKEQQELEQEAPSKD